MPIKLRKYQQECIDAVERAGEGSHLVVMATGLGKTVTFANIPRHGRVLILSHRDELVRQPEKYYDCSFGIEKAGDRSNGEEVVSATVQTLASPKRLHSFKPGDFDMVITDEAHHAVAPSYRKIIEYLQPRVHLGFTATPNRADGKGLSDAFDDIVFERDLRWGIEHGYLSDIDCRRVTVGWKTRDVHRRAGDFAINELDQKVNTKKTNAQVAEAYRQLAVGQTLIFATSVDHAYELAKLIDGAEVVDGKTPAAERRDVIERFTNREFPCLINYGVFTEGTDLPLIETVLLARPTTNQSLYSQMVGRGLRLSEGKKALRLIDCVGNTDDNRLCTAPKLFGIDESELSAESRAVVDGLITGLTDRIIEADDTPYGWVLREQKIDLMGEECYVAWIAQPGAKRVVAGNSWEATLSGPDLMDKYTLEVRDGDFVGKQVFDSFSEADQVAYSTLQQLEHAAGQDALWDKEIVDHWGAYPASGKQVNYLMSLLDKDQLAKLGQIPLSKREAMVAIQAALNAKNRRQAELYGKCPNCGHAIAMSSTKKTYQCSSNKWSNKPDGKWRLVGGCGFSMPAKAGNRTLPTDVVRKLLKGEKVRFGSATLLPQRNGRQFEIQEVPNLSD